MSDMPIPPIAVPEAEFDLVDEIGTVPSEAEIAEARAKHPSAVPELETTPGWSGDTDRRVEAGPMYPDLFQQAVAGNHLADVVTVHFADGEPRPSLDVPQSTGRPADARELVTTSARTPAEVGAFMGASAKKRRRLHF